MCDLDLKWSRQEWLDAPAVKQIALLRRVSLLLVKCTARPFVNHFVAASSVRYPPTVPLWEL